MQGSMNKESLVSLNKISLEMDRLSSLINKEERLHNQLQSMLQQQEDLSNDSSQAENFDQYFNEYNNPTTKSLPIDEDSHLSHPQEQEDTEIMNTIYRNRLAEESAEQEDRLHDDKSTVILNGNKISRKEREVQPKHPPPVNYYSSVNQDNRPRKDASKNKKSSNKNPTSSMPAEVIQKPLPIKNSSLPKQAKTDSPLAAHAKAKRETEAESNFIKELKGKLSKVSKIDREQLTRLQERKAHKKTELSSNRKKTKRDLGSAKSTAALCHTQKSSQTTIPLNHKNHSNVSCKALQTRKKESLSKKPQEKGLSNHEWQRNLQKAGKKLNRVNICKLQENIKKNHQKKSQLKETVHKKTLEKHHKRNNERKELKLHFTETDETVMKKLIDQKDLGREYNKETEKYLQATRKMSKDYFEMLIKECREPSQEAIFKLRLVSLLLYFFDQFAASPLLPRADINVSQQEIIDILLHPKRALRLMQQLPNTLMGDNKVSGQRMREMRRQFQELNKQLDQQLQFFLIKKTLLYIFVHTLLEYVSFLTERQLVAFTTRNRLLPQESQQKLQGYYSSRSKREEISKKYIKKTEKANKFGFRCDSDRKITLEDEQAFLKGAFNCPRSQPLKKGPK